MLKTSKAIEEKRFLNMENWRQNFIKNRVKTRIIVKMIGSNPRTYFIITQKTLRYVKWRLFACEQLLERYRRTGYRYRTVTEDEENTKRRNPGERQTAAIQQNKKKLTLQHDNVRPYYQDILKTRKYIPFQLAVFSEVASLEYYLLLSTVYGRASMTSIFGLRKK